MANAENKIPMYKIVCFQNRFTTGVGIELTHWYTQGEKPDGTFRMTIGVDFQVKEIFIQNTIVKMAFWRLSGQERFGFIRGSFYKGGAAVIIVYTLLNLEQGKKYVQDRLEEVRNYIGNVPVLVVAVDLDKVQSNDLKSNPINKEIRSFVSDKGGLYVETSSNTIDIFSSGIEHLMEQVLEKKNREESNTIIEGELILINDIEKVIGRKIPELDIEKEELFGYKIENNHITELYLQGLKLKSLTDKIENLNHLKILDLKSNLLTQLPSSISNLKSLILLNLSNNNMSIIPADIWSLENIKLLQLKDNPWKGESKDYFDKSPDIIRDFCRKRANIHIFISHAVTDYEKYKIKEVSEYLSNQDEIYKVFYCEEDLKGNIDEFMNKTIPQCQLLLFIATKKSIFESSDCRHEIDLARTHNLQIIPIKGQDVEWEDLNNVGIGRELGLDFDSQNYNIFCKQLYQFILDFKRKIDLINKEKGKVDKLLLEVIGFFEDYLKSDDIHDKFRTHLNKINNLKSNYNDGTISFRRFLKKIIRIVS